MRYILLFCVLTAVLSPVCLAHSPADITASLEAEAVSVKVSHYVGDPAAHYIKRIQIMVNGVPGIKKGDTITVTAFCSRSGSLAKEITIE